MDSPISGDISNTIPRISSLSGLPPSGPWMQTWKDRQLINAVHETGLRRTPRDTFLHAEAVRSVKMSEAPALGTDLHNAIAVSIGLDPTSHHRSFDPEDSEYVGLLEEQKLGPLVPDINIQSSLQAARTLEMSWKLFYLEYGNMLAPVYAEQRLAAVTARGYQYSGSPDMVAHDRSTGELAVIDWKTSKAIRQSYAVQINGYSRLLGAHGVETTRGLIVRLYKQGSPGYEIGVVNMGYHHTLDDLLEVHNLQYAQMVEAVL